jgi:hypothetical protein
MPGLWMHMLDFARAMPLFPTALALMREPDWVIESVRWVLCPGGRFVGEMGREGATSPRLKLRGVSTETRTRRVHH